MAKAAPRGPLAFQLLLLLWRWLRWCGGAVQREEGEQQLRGSRCATGHRLTHGRLLRFELALRPTPHVCMGHDGDGDDDGDVHERD